MSERIFQSIIKARASNGASDLHIGVGRPIGIRIYGHIEWEKMDPLTRAEVVAFQAAALDDNAKGRLKKMGIVDAAYYSQEVGSLRLHFYEEENGPAVAIRILAKTIPELASLGLPSIVHNFPSLNSGLVLFAGPTGAGKTTTLAALVDTINERYKKKILTIEDPIEYHHESKLSVVDQSEVGRHVKSWAEATRGALRADPDVIVIGEMRDSETMAAGMQAAETGHLVFGTMHTDETWKTIDRIIGTFPTEKHDQVRLQISQILEAVVVLRLIPRRDGQGLRVAAEIMVVNDAIRSMIREGKTHLLRNAIQTGKASGMQTLEGHLNELVLANDIRYEDAVAAANHPAEIRKREVA